MEKGEEERRKRVERQNTETAVRKKYGEKERKINITKKGVYPSCLMKSNHPPLSSRLKKSYKLIVV